MADTLRSHVSAIRSLSKLFSADNRITARALAYEIRSTVLQLIKQQTDKRRLWQSPNLFTRINCIELEPASLAECCNFRGVCTIRKSKYKLPRIAEGLFGLLIQGVYSIDSSTSFKYSSPERYTNLKKLGLACLPDCYWIADHHLYVTAEHLERVTLLAYPEEDIPSGLEACSDQSNGCINPLDRSFYIPGFLRRQVTDLVFDRLSKTYFQLSQDYTADGKDQMGK
jgi:hypothetical protein